MTCSSHIIPIMDVITRYGVISGDVRGKRNKIRFNLICCISENFLKRWHHIMFLCIWKCVWVFMIGVPDINHFLFNWKAFLLWKAHSSNTTGKYYRKGKGKSLRRYRFIFYFSPYIVLFWFKLLIHFYVRLCQTVLYVPKTENRDPEVFFFGSTPAEKKEFLSVCATGSSKTERLAVFGF